MQNNPILEGYLTDAEEAAALGKCQRTLKRWRAERKGPPTTWIGNRPYYRVESSRAWLAAQEQGGAKSLGRRARGV